MESLIKLFSKLGIFIGKVLKSLDIEKTVNIILILILAFFILVFRAPAFLFRWDSQVLEIFTKNEVTSDITTGFDFSVILQIILLSCLGVLIYKVTLKKSCKVSFLHLMLIITLYVPFSLLIFKIGLRLNTIILPIFLIIFWVIALISKYCDKASKVNDLKQAISQYVSPQILDRILSNPKSLRLGGQTRKMTVLFTDIRNFTTISEKTKAINLINFVNKYFDSITKTILRNDGTIDKFAGDSLMAFWNAPIAEPEHALRACITALKILKDLQSYNGDKENSPKIETGIGINTGKIIVGNVGSKNRFDYTVLGDDVNIASRLEGLTRLYKVPIILGHKTVLELKRTAKYSQFSIRLLDLVKVKGKDKQVGIYELMGTKDEDLKSFAEMYEEAFFLYKEKKFDQASQLFIRILSEQNDHPSKMMLVRCYQFMEDPPSAQWDGTWEWTSK